MNARVILYLAYVALILFMGIKVYDNILSNNSRFTKNLKKVESHGSPEIP